MMMIMMMMVRSFNKNKLKNKQNHKIVKFTN
jgi:hypothetical protein